MLTRIFDAPSVDKLSTLVSIAKDNGLAVSIDFIAGSRKSKIDTEIWIVQIYDKDERLVVSANGKTANDAIRRLHENWFSKTAPKT
ncbi:MAG: hypothetical protein ACK5HO_00225 [Pseudomonadota bacterium]